MVYALWSTIVYRFTRLHSPMIDRWIRRAYESAVFLSLSLSLSLSPFLSVREVWWCDLSRDARTRYCAPEFDEASSRVSVADELASIPSIFLSPWFLANPPWTNHRITRPLQRTAPEQTASHRTATPTPLARSLFLSLSRYCKLHTAPCYSAYSLLSYPIIGYTRATPLLSTACGTIKLQLSYQRICVSHPCVKVVVFLYFIFFSLFLLIGL